MADLGNDDIGEYAMNWSSISTTKPIQSPDDAFLIAIYNKVELSSAIILLIFSPITVFTNGLFLLALYQDSLKCFRKSPSTFFVAGLSMADFITGLLVEPSFAIHYFLRYFNFQDGLEITKLIYTIGGTLSTIAISTSFVIVLAMSLSQYIAIRYPHQYKAIVTTKRVIRLLWLSGLYFLAFSMLQFTGISRKKFLLLDVILHPTLISFLLIVVLILMRKAFKKYVSKPARKRTRTPSRKATSSRNESRNELEGTSSSTIRSTSASSNSSRMQFSPSPKSPLLTGSPGQDEISCKRLLHRNDNITKKSMVGRLTQVETVYEEFDERKTNPYNGDGSSAVFHRVEPITTIKIQEHNGTEEVKIDVDDNMNGLHGFDQDMENKVLENDKKSPVSHQLLSLGLKTLRHSFYRRPSRRKPPVERQFAIMSFYLAAILLLSSLSHTVVFYVFLLKKPESIPEDVYVNIALRITDLMLFLKVLLDAFIFAWRLPTYRRSLVKTISCGRIRLTDDA